MNKLKCLIIKIGGYRYGKDLYRKRKIGLA